MVNFEGHEKRRLGEIDMCDVCLVDRQTLSMTLQGRKQSDSKKYQHLEWMGGLYFFFLQRDPKSEEVRLTSLFV